MNERERLIELIEQAFNQADYNYGMPNTEQVTDYLLDNGVITSPVKVGDTVYHFGYSFRVEKIEIVQGEIFYKCGNYGTDDYMSFCESDIGKTVFLTKEEAEKALKGGDME